MNVEVKLRRKLNIESDLLIETIIIITSLHNNKWIAMAESLKNILTII